MQAAAGAALTPEGDLAAADAPRRLTLLAVVALVGWGVDVATKVAAVGLLTGRDPVQLVPGVLTLTLTRNPGAAFSVATSMTAVLTVVALGVVAAVLRLAGRIRSRVWAVALGLLLGGALGNLTDRMLREPGPFRGHVVDFLQLPHWPVFNLADSCIVVAAVLIAVQSLRGAGLDGRHADHDDTT
ncbi:MAG: signal peptidase II [Actinomycetota bacterium]|nr:signal peptidase II [Nocardioidaceae bacterium]MDQ3591516.1 signal peptidase II [Actinomycetota bacterium]